jgi:DnaJ-class molecular chaperone
MYQVTITCPNCDGAGSYAMTADPYAVEHECCACEGRGRTLISEAAEFYENTADLLEDYPDAIKIERVA